MENNNKNEIVEEQPFILIERYPDTKYLFSTPLKSYKVLRKKCIFVLDTNILLKLYNIEKKNLIDIKEKYKLLIQKNSLFIPAQVAREFVEQRTNMIKTIIQQLKEKKRINLITTRYFPLRSLNGYQDVIKFEEEINPKLVEYKKAITKALNNIKDWNWNDPVSLLYKDLFKKDCIIDIKEDRNKLEKELTRRLKYNIPPGFKDKSKHFNKEGDFLIWFSILELAKIEKKHVIFVSDEKKSDWYVKCINEEWYPRFELIDEFKRKSNGKSFYIIDFTEFLNLIGVKEEIIDDAMKENLQLQIEMEEDYEVSGDILARKMRNIENAIEEWIKEVLLAKNIIKIYMGGPDFIYTNIHENKVGVEVKYITYFEPNRLKKQIFNISNRRWLDSDDLELEHLDLFLIAENEKLAKKIINWVKEEIHVVRNYIHIFIGYIYKDGKFISIYDKRF